MSTHHDESPHVDDPPSASLLPQVREKTLFASQTYSGSPRILCRRCHVLRLTTAQVRQCHTIGDVQVLARQQYRQLVKRYHPDVVDMRSSSASWHPGQTFRLMTRTYQWLMALPTEQQILWAPPPVPQWDSEPLHLPWGWQEWI